MAKSDGNGTICRYNLAQWTRVFNFSKKYLHAAPPARFPRFPRRARTFPAVAPRRPGARKIANQSGISYILRRRGFIILTTGARQTADLLQNRLCGFLPKRPNNEGGRGIPARAQPQKIAEETRGGEKRPSRFEIARWTRRAVLISGSVLPADGGAKQVIRDRFPALKNSIFIGAEAVKNLSVGHRTGSGLHLEKYALSILFSRAQEARSYRTPRCHVPII